MTSSAGIISSLGSLPPPLQDLIALVKESLSACEDSKGPLDKKKQEIIKALPIRLYNFEHACRLAYSEKKPDEGTKKIIVELMERAQPIAECSMRQTALLAAKEYLLQYQKEHSELNLLRGAELKVVSDGVLYQYPYRVTIQTEVETIETDEGSVKRGICLFTLTAEISTIQQGYKCTQISEEHQFMENSPGIKSSFEQSKEKYKPKPLPNIELYIEQQTTQQKNQQKLLDPKAPTTLSRYQPYRPGR